MPQKILFLVPYPVGESPSQRFRFEQYFNLLRKKNFHIDVQSFLNSHNWQLFFKSGNSIGKAFALVTGFLKRIVALVHAPFYDFIFIHREVTPIGPPVFEWILAFVLRKKIIYDFDDAIWLTDRTDESLLTKVLKCRRKIRSICRWSYKVSCGNEYLCEYARKYNDRVIYNPTTLETDHRHNPDLYSLPVNDDKPVIGWTGSHSTLKYLKALESSLQKIEEQFPQVTILVIANQAPSLNLKNLVFMPWQESTEVSDLMRIDIGIMPLPDDEWSKGKCGFKALQYLSLRIPAVASPVGVNTKIITNNKNGFLCSSTEAWELALTTLLLDPALRKQMGARGREMVVGNYSVSSNSTSFVSIFE